MGFAIKITKENETRYFSQVVESLSGLGFNKMVLLADGSDPDEVDISRTLVQAEKKLELVNDALRVPDARSAFDHNNDSFFPPTAKIVEYPEVNDNDQEES